MDIVSNHFNIGMVTVATGKAFLCVSAQYESNRVPTPCSGYGTDIATDSSLIDLFNDYCVLTMCHSLCEALGVHC